MGCILEPYSVVWVGSDGVVACLIRRVEMLRYNLGIAFDTVLAIEASLFARAERRLSVDLFLSVIVPSAVHSTLLSLASTSPLVEFPI